MFELLNYDMELATVFRTHVADLGLGFIALVIICALVLTVIYLQDPHQLRRPSIQGPFIAAITDAWLAYVSLRGKRCEYVSDLHQKYGKFVRIAPNHVSVNDPNALQAIYGHGTGTLKPDFYDAFVSFRRGMFSTRDRADHTRKRKLVSHAFSSQNVTSLQPYVRKHLRMLCAHWDLRCAQAAQVGEKSKGIAWFDCIPSYGYLTFDIVGDLAFGTPFGMTKRHEDKALLMVPGKSPNDDPVVKYVPAVEILTQRGGFGASIGVIPLWLRPLVRYLPIWMRSRTAVKAFEDTAMAAVDRRLKLGQMRDEDDWESLGSVNDVEAEGKPVQTRDLLEQLLQGKDENGDPIGKVELAAEALTLMAAGSDTTGNSCGAITYYLAANPSIQKKLQDELDQATPSERTTHPLIANPTNPQVPDASVATTFNEVKSLPYLHACINEGLRLYSTAGLGLPRAVPPDASIEVCGEVFNEGSILSVPIYDVHRDKSIWGDDADQYRPERWFEREVGKEFVPFSVGPRACIGRNLAMMELAIIISTIFRRYEIRLESPDQELYSREGFLRRPLECVVGVKRREVTLK